MASRPSKNYEFYQWVEVFANRKFRLKHGVNELAGFVPEVGAEMGEAVEARKWRGNRCPEQIIRLA